MRPPGVGVSVFAPSAAVLAWLARPAVGFRDAGELATASYVLGVAHPTGFSVDLLWLRLWAMLPLGDVAARQNLGVAITAAAALGVLAALVELACRRLGAPAGATVAAWLAALAMLCWQTFLGTAIAVEVYSTALLAVLFSALALARGGCARGLPVVVVGLSPGLHVTAGLYSLMLTLGALARRVFAWAALWRRLPALLAGALILAYLPLASRRDPPIDWGDPETLPAMLAHLTAARIRASYRGEMLGGDVQGAATVFAQLLELWPLLPFSALALAVGLSRARGIALGALSLLGADLAYAAWINPMGAVDRQVGHVAGAVLVGSGAAGFGVLLQWLRARGRVRGLGVAMGAALAALLVARAPADTLADGYVADELFGDGGPLAALPPRAVLLCGNDDACAAGLFALHVERVRPDADVAPAQHLWDPTVLRQLEGWPAWSHPSAPPRPDARAARAAAVAARLASEPAPRPVLWETRKSLSALGDRVEILAAPLPPYLVAVSPENGRRWPSGVVERLDRMRAARLGAGAPRSALGREAWSRAYETVGKHALGTRGVHEGMGALATAIAIAPDRPTPWVNLGVLRENVGDLRGAIEATRRAVELGPERPTGWVNLARLQLRVGDAAAARAVLETAARLGIRDPRLQAVARRLSGP
jgi:hypothetical protein